MNSHRAKEQGSAAQRRKARTGLSALWMFACVSCVNIDSREVLPSSDGASGSAASDGKTADAGGAQAAGAGGARAAGGQAGSPSPSGGAHHGGSGGAGPIPHGGAPSG